MTTPFSPDRSDAIRAALLDTIRASSREHLTRRRWLPAVGMLCLGLVTGAAVSAAALTSVPTPPPVMTEDGVPAPPGIMPGQPIISLLGDISSFEVNGTTTILLPSAPAGATHMRVSMNCLTAGTTAWGTNPNGSNPETSCNSDDGDADQVAYLDLSLESRPQDLYVTALLGVESIFTIQYLNYVETAWGVNAHGETYGVGKDGFSPDLIAVTGTNGAGEAVEGYARSEALIGSGPDHTGLPTNPEQALEWQREMELRYPDGWDIPIYDFDGTTQLGVLHLGG